MIYKATILFLVFMGGCVAPKSVSIEFTGVNVINRSPYGQNDSPNQIAEEEETEDTP